jgi:hypothetical protein
MVIRARPEPRQTERTTSWTRSGSKRKRGGFSTRLYDARNLLASNCPARESVSQPPRTPGAFRCRSALINNTLTPVRRLGYPEVFEDLVGTARQRGAFGSGCVARQRRLSCRRPSRGDHHDDLPHGRADPERRIPGGADFGTDDGVTGAGEALLGAAAVGGEWPTFLPCLPYNACTVPPTGFLVPAG